MNARSVESLIVACFLIVGFGLGVALAQLMPSPDEPQPIYVEVDVPDRIIACISLASSLSCDWSRPVAEVSSIPPIERQPEHTQGDQ